MTYADTGHPETAPATGGIRAAAVSVLAAADPQAKADSARAVAAAWRAGTLRPPAANETVQPPDRPGRPTKPDLVGPGAVPRRRINSAPAGRIALLHALAHIELNAIDLAFDMIARYACADLPYAFIDDWVRVGDEEASHFILLADRLTDLEAGYGDLPAHDGLWESAHATAHDLAARLAVVPLVLEARGLDVTPAMAAKLRKAGDEASAETLDRIYRDEIGHVAIGQRWFAFVCAARGAEPAALWQALVRQHFRGTLKRPFNAEGRDAAGLPADWYEPLAMPS